MSRQDYNSRYKYDRQIPKEFKTETKEELEGKTGPKGPKGPKGQDGSKINLVVSGCSRLNVRETPDGTSNTNILFVVTEGTRLVGNLPQSDWTYVTEVSPSKRSGYVMTQFVSKI